MCGIAGEFRFDAQASVADWHSLSEMMSTRGPDDQGFWNADSEATFIFRRLAIQDLSPNGAQPMVSRDGRYVLVFNGEVYNFPQLRQELQSQGRTFRSSSDTEVVLESLIVWGKEAIDKFNGMFALAFYDTREKKLLLTRDHAGMKPLYYLKSPQGIFFASQYNQILAHPWRKNATVSQDALALYFRLGYIPAPYAIFEHTKMLAPGTILEIDKDGNEQSTTWFQLDSSDRQLSLKGEAALEALDSALRNAVRRHLVSDVPIAVLLSGGVDSPLMTALVKEYADPSLRAFTLGTEDERTDESSAAKKYADQIGLDHIVHKMSSQEALDLLDDILDASGEPFGDYSIFPSMVISKAVRQNYKVVISGDGGDELFWGYANRSIPLLNASDYFKYPYPLRKMHHTILTKQGRAPKTWFSTAHTLGDAYQRFHNHLPEHWLNKIFPELSPVPRTFTAFQYSGSRKNQTSHFMRNNEYECHLPMVLLKMDRASMFYSLETRMPFLDREVIDTALKIDWRQCVDLDSSVGKIPLRRLLSRHMSFQTKAKKGFSVPMGEWLRTSLRTIFMEKVVRRKDIMGIPIDQRQMERLFADHGSGSHDYAWGLWPILSLALWEDRYL